MFAEVRAHFGKVRRKIVEVRPHFVEVSLKFAEVRLHFGERWAHFPEGDDHLDVLGSLLGEVVECQLIGVAQLRVENEACAKLFHGSLLFPMRRNLLNFARRVDIKKTIIDKYMPLLYIRTIDRHIRRWSRVALRYQHSLTPSLPHSGF